MGEKLEGPGGLSTEGDSKMSPEDKHNTRIRGREGRRETSPRFTETYQKVRVGGVGDGVREGRNGQIVRKVGKCLG